MESNLFLEQCPVRSDAVWCFSVASQWSHFRQHLLVTHTALQGFLYMSFPYRFFSSACLWFSGVCPADWDPVSLSLHLLQCQLQLTERCREVIVDDDLLKQVSVLALHQQSCTAHLLEVFLLVGGGRDEQERGLTATWWREGKGGTQKKVSSTWNLSETRKWQTEMDWRYNTCSLQKAQQSSPFNLDRKCTHPHCGPHSKHFAHKKQTTGNAHDFPPLATCSYPIQKKNTILLKRTERTHKHNWKKKNRTSKVGITVPCHLHLFKNMTGTDSLRTRPLL